MGQSDPKPLKTALPDDLGPPPTLEEIGVTHSGIEASGFCDTMRMLKWDLTQAHWHRGLLLQMLKARDKQIETLTRGLAECEARDLTGGR